MLTQPRSATTTPNTVDSSTQHHHPLHLVSCVIPSHDPATDEVFTPRSVTMRAICRFLADVPNDLAVELVTVTDHHIFDPINPITAAETLRARMIIDRTIANTQPGFPRHWTADDIRAWTTAIQSHIDTAMHPVVADALIEIDQAQRNGDIHYERHNNRWFAISATRTTTHPSYMTAISMLDMFDYFIAAH